MATPQETLFLKTQIQIAQLEVVFNGPLIKNSIVENLIDLTTLNYNYEHKMIWVRNEESNYFLTDGDGTQISHWKKQTNKLVLEQYKSTETWFKDDTVYLGGKIYKALQNVPLNFNPIDNPLYWLLITGEQITSRYIFNNVSNFVFFTDIKNPIFQILKCTFVFDLENNYILDIDGLIKIENSEIIEGYIKRRDDLPNNNGMAYEISFEENGLPIQLTGVVNIK